jgi:hypothetical protein
MKMWSFFLIIAFLVALPLSAQTVDTDAKIAERSKSEMNVKELKQVSRLPEVVKDARDAGAEEEEIQSIIKGVKDKKLSADEGANTITTMEENTRTGKSNKGISKFVFQQKANGVKGKELGQAIKKELQERHQIKKQEPKDKEEDEEEQKKQKIKKEKQTQQMGSQDEEETDTKKKEPNKEAQKQNTEDEDRRTNAEPQKQEPIKKKADEDSPESRTKKKDKK